MLNPRITQFHDRYEYREPVAWGARVVEVYIATPTLRLVIYVETPQGRLPMGVFVDELDAIIQDVKGRIPHRTISDTKKRTVASLGREQM